MAISKLDFARGQVVNPLDSIGDDLLKFGSSLHQQEKDRLDTIRQVNADKRAQEQLDMQKQQYADQKEKEAAMQAFAAGISKPRQLAESAMLYKQVEADPAAFDKRLENVAYTEPENVYTRDDTDQATKDRLVASGMVNPAEVERKTRQQMDLAGMVLAPTDAMKETRTQQIERTMQEMANKGQPITTAIYQELDKARLADETAKTAKEKSLDELIKDSRKERIDMLKYGATALDKLRSGGVTVDDDGTLHYGGAAGTKALTSALDAEKKRIIGYQDAIASIPAAINKVTEKNKPTEEVRAAMTKSANELVDALVANKVDPKVAGELVASQLSAGESGYLWGTLFGKDGSVKAINPDTMNSLIASGKKLSEIEQQKALVTAGGSVPKGSMAYELGVGLSGQADADLASLKAKKQVLDMTPEERQYAATKNRLDEILKPAVEAERGSASGKEYLTTKDGKTTANIPTNIQKEMDFANSQLMIPQKVRTKDGREVVVRYSDDDRAAILAQLLSESKFDIKATGDKGTAHGLFQWRFDRADALRKFAGEQDISRIPEEKQYEFFTNEMASRPPVDKRYGSMLEEFQAIDGAKNKAEYLSKHYEVAKGTSTLEGEAKVRGELADALLKKYQESQAGLTNDALSRSMEAGRNIKEFNVRTGKANDITRDTIMRPTISLYDRMTYDPLAPTGPSNIDAPTARKLSSDISTLVKDDLNNSVLNRVAKSTSEFFGRNYSVNNYENRTLARVNTLLKNAGVDTSNPEELLNAANSLDSDSKKPVIKLAHDKLMQEDAEYRKYYDSQQLSDATSMIGRTAVDTVGGVVLEKLLAGYLTNRAITKTAEGFAKRMAKSAARNAKRNTKTDDVIEVGSNQLTPQKQKAIDDYINAYIDKFGKGPSTEEIRTLFDL